MKWQRRRTTQAFAAALAVCAAACSHGIGPIDPAGRPNTGFVLTGDPATAAGATWGFYGEVSGVYYAIHGFLMKPAGTGPFPAILLSHGAGGTAAGYGGGLCPEFVKWGLVCIAVEYTHAANGPTGEPVGIGELGGASPANLLRGQRAYELLRDLKYVDMGRVAAHGNSMGAFVTTALVAAHPDEFRAASHTGGGLRPTGNAGISAPDPTAVSAIRTPYQMHHGADDTIIPLTYEVRLDSILAARKIPHALVVHTGLDHATMAGNAAMLQQVHDWYAAQGMF